MFDDWGNLFLPTYMIQLVFLFIAIVLATGGDLFTFVQ